MSAAKQNGIARGYAVFEYQLSQHRTHCAFLLGRSPLLFPNQVQNIACQVEGACHHEQCSLMARFIPRCFPCSPEVGLNLTGREKLGKALCAARAAILHLRRHNICPAFFCNLPQNRNILVFHRSHKHHQLAPCKLGIQRLLQLPQCIGIMSPIQKDILFFQILLPRQHGCIGNALAHGLRSDKNSHMRKRPRCGRSRRRVEGLHFPEQLCFQAGKFLIIELAIR